MTLKIPPAAIECPSPRPHWRWLRLSKQLLRETTVPCEKLYLVVVDSKTMVLGSDGVFVGGDVGKFLVC